MISGATQTLTYTGAACVSTATLALRAAGRDGLVPADGACPDDYAAYGPSPRAEWGAFTVHNRTDAPITLYQLGEGDPVLIGDISAQSALPTSGALDGYYDLANGSDVSECAFLFRLTEDGQTIVWDGGA